MGFPQTNNNLKIFYILAKTIFPLLNSITKYFVVGKWGDKSSNLSSRIESSLQFNIRRVFVTTPFTLGIFFLRNFLTILF